MIRRLRALCAPVALGVLAGIAPATSGATESAPKPDTYLCPNATGGGIDCFLHAIEHLYTMCRQVKSIEIIEFGYEKSTEGTNGAKSEYCVDKHRVSIVRPYQSALREATPNRSAVESVRALHDLWLRALADLRWVPGETDADYKARVARPYELFSERASAVRALLVAKDDKAAGPGKGKAAAAAVSPSRPKGTN